jgi:hypothetical protein
MNSVSYKEQMEITQFAQNFTNEVINYINSNMWIGGGFQCQTKFDWSERRAKSWGGLNTTGRFISIAMCKYYRPQTSVDDLFDYHEYASFDNDEEIGGFATDDWKLVLKTIICHELAHAIRPSDSHGNFWKEDYRQLREKFINNYIDRTFKMSERKPNENRALYEKHCIFHGMKKEWFGRLFKYDNHTWKIVGWTPTARKYVVNVFNLEKSKEYRMQVHQITSALWEV